ncbi:hypothetical protein G3480_22445 [Thiorhodococcus mannitoliphagus]|uniref:PcfJ-like protein n=1 Tax=Thiorhodococcus mannitoliphagus TaxID=329406 RepID=A0A6P1E4S1_9GAMM|nr:PcfJ domain-containing protein [Thiorhodococcus mannitoliphagus]NEX23024.1 hypothetical protein [Thiorhodococcus mannitoliphagus]
MRIDACQSQLNAEGELILDLPYPAEGRLRYGPWAAGLPVARWDSGGWCPESLDPGIPLLQAAQQARGEEPLSAFVAPIPLSVRLRAERYWTCQTHLLQWIATRRAAADLFAQSPTLLWLLLVTAHRAGWSETIVDQLLARRRSSILEELTGTGAEAAVKFIDRIELLHGDHVEYALILNFLDRHREPLWREFNQWPRIPVHVLAIRLDYPALAGMRVLKTLGNHRYQRLTDATAAVAQKQSLWRDTRNLGALLHIADVDQVLAQCASFEALERLHDRWMQRVNRQPTLARRRGLAFPPPPLPGTPVIQPILNADDLAKEGRDMRHCVASYAGRVRNRRCYIYRLLEPERATIEIVLGGAEPTIGQFKLAGNREPSPASREVVAVWLKYYS